MSTTKPRSREGLMEFLDYLGNKGLLPSNTVSARRAVAKKVLAIISDDEAEDVLSIDVDDLMDRFSNLHRMEYTPDSMATYRSRLHSTMKDFEAYLRNPSTFRPSGRSRSGKAAVKNGSDTPSPARNNTGTTGQSSVRDKVAEDASTVIPIQIRADLIVRIQGIPFDLKKPEAQRIANVVLALASPESS